MAQSAAADPQLRRRHLDLRRLGQPAPGGPGRGRSGRHGRDGERRAERARGRLRRGERRRSRGRTEDWAQIYPLIEAIMAATVHRGGQGRPGGGGLPRRHAASPVRRARPRGDRPHHATREGSARCRPRPPRRSQRGAPGTVHGRPPEGRRPAPRTALHRRRVPPRPVAHVHRRRRPQLRAHDHAGRRGHGRGHRRRGRGRLRREGRVGPADAQGALRAPAPDRRPRRRERRPPRPAGVGQHRQAVAVAQDDVAQTIDTFRFMAGAHCGRRRRRQRAATPRTTCRSSCASRSASSGS